MRVRILAFLLAALPAVQGFTAAFSHINLNQARIGRTPLAISRPLVKMAAATEEITETEEAALGPPSPEELKTTMDVDFMPLATALMNKDFKEADQITRDLLIYIAGPEARKRKFVYWTEVQSIPKEDLSTIERLWLKYTDGKQGYSVQKKIWRVQKGNFENFCKKIGWNIVDEELERKRRWFGNDEFIYDLKKAPKGHLPLTSALRGTQLLSELMKHPAWDDDEFSTKK